MADSKLFQLLDFAANLAILAAGFSVMHYWFEVNALVSLVLGYCVIHGPWRDSDG
jgi:hypothetical protein